MKKRERGRIALLAHHLIKKIKASRAIWGNFGVILLLLSAPVHADKLILGGVSHHFNNIYNTNYDFNEIHESLGYERGNLELGAFNNSVERTSYFIAFIDRPWTIGKGFSAGYRFGLATGYKDVEWVNDEGEDKTTKFINGGILPQAQFLLSYQAKLFTIDLGIAPVSALTFKLNL